ncbi:MAG: DUF1295 domain-containing protein [Rikenellaceae bacterium]|nr:DUF1295 domain-containing protein [Rikenellaceae bacterium]
MPHEHFRILLYSMIVLTAIVFVILYFINAGYGMFRQKNWGPTVNNKLGWMIMECPVFIVMLSYWISSDRKFMIPYLIFFLLFQLHYFNRAFIFPFLLKGKSRMPIVITISGMIFNLINGVMQGEWIFRQSPIDLYGSLWLTSPYFIIGVALFFAGMIINIHSDQIIRNLRKPGDSKHYLPDQGLYKYVTSANYFGEIIEWTGFAVLTWSLSGFVFVIWCFANLVPRANSIYKKYKQEFGEGVGGRKRIFPFIY